MPRALMIQYLERLPFIEGHSLFSSSFMHEIMTNSWLTPIIITIAHWLPSMFCFSMHEALMAVVVNFVDMTVFTLRQLKLVYCLMYASTSKCHMQGVK